VTQRISFLSCTFYYLQSVLALITAVMPSLVMIWCFPNQVDPRNYCPLAPAMLGMFAMPVMIRGWRPPILRLVMIYSVAHLLAITDSLRGSAAAWVPTGGSGHRNPTPVMAGRVLLSVPRLQIRHLGSRVQGAARADQSDGAAVRDHRGRAYRDRRRRSREDHLTR